MKLNSDLSPRDICQLPLHQYSLHYDFPSRNESAVSSFFFDGGSGSVWSLASLFSSPVWMSAFSWKISLHFYFRTAMAIECCLTVRKERWRYLGSKAAAKIGTLSAIPISSGVKWCCKSSLTVFFKFSKLLLNLLHSVIDILWANN